MNQQGELQSKRSEILGRTESAWFTLFLLCAVICILKLFWDNLPNEMAHKKIYYSEKYYDNEFEYRHVVLPKELVKLVPKNHLLSETEWRDIGVQQSEGWIHYMTHEPEPHILLFKRKITTPPPKDAC